MARTVTRTRALFATLYGRTWGGFDGELEISATLKPGPVAAQLERIKREKGGDFQHCELTGEVRLTRTRTETGPHSVRQVQRLRVLPVATA